ncbi:efflux RND transporter permease subunit [Acidocella sp.]|uniref:efflux RND transporter permease subunit n=1 Tax=Acidocella sp. TaxID=50710 RepID=UPI002612DA06|nr:efflux RND transporter permease subunit [Acidocella sp.]
MNLIDWIEHHRRSLVFVALALAAAGLFAGASLPVGLFPVTSFPRIRIEVSTTSMPARQMLIDVTEPLEEVARAVPGVVDVVSTTSRGSAQIFVDFPWNANMKQALLSVDAAFAQAIPGLPPGTQYDAIQMSPNELMPFVSYALTSQSVPSSELRRLAQYQITPLLSGIDGIRRVGVLGGQTPEVQVRVDPAKLQAYNLTLTDVATAISAANTIDAVGRLQDNDLLYLAISNNAFQSVQSVRDVTLRLAGGGILRLSDIATVTLGAKPEWLLIDNNGQPAVTFDVYQQDSADSLGMERAVSQKLASFMKTQPDTIHLHKWYDQTQLVRSSIGAVEEAILIGLIFAAMVMLAFLRNWRVTLVAIMVVPLSVLITVLLLSLFGMTFNIMTLGGIAAAIGLLIDDAIVMIEHIARRAGAPGLKDANAHVLVAAREFLSPLLGSSLATTIIFIPLAFLSGITGAFFKFLSLTMASALIISFILTAFTVPLLARSIIDFGKWEDPGHGRETWLRRTHGRMLRGLFARPWLLAAGLAVLILAGLIAHAHVGTGFLPRMDEGGFVLDYQTAPGTSLTETNRELSEVEAILKQDPAVDTFSRRTGAGLGGDLAESYQGDFFVRLVAPGRRPNIWKVMDGIDAKVTSQVPGIAFDTHQLLSDMIGDMVGRRQPVVIQLSAKNPDVLPGIAGKVADAIAQVPGIQPASVDDGVVPAGDALEIHVDAAAAAMEGVTPQDVEASLYHYLNGAVVTHYLGTEQDIGVRLWLAVPQTQIYRDDLGNLPIRSPSGNIFPLKTIATVNFVAGQPEITRENLQQVVAVTAQIGGGHDLGSTIAAVQKTLRQPGFLPSGVNYTIGGAYKQQQIAMHGMIRVFAAAAIAEIILLLFLYERFALPFIIVLSAVISTGAVYLGLWITGVELNITGMMGMVMIVGIATEMAIFLVSEFQALERVMPARQALYEAALNRLRPILMSSLAMILALLPLGAALSGSGDEMLQPLAIAIISGIIVQMPLVLLAMPVVIGLTIRKRDM